MVKLMRMTTWLKMNNKRRRKKRKKLFHQLKKDSKTNKVIMWWQPSISLILGRALKSRMIKNKKNLILIALRGMVTRKNQFRKSKNKRRNLNKVSFQSLYLKTLSYIFVKFWSVQWLILLSFCYSREKIIKERVKS